MGIDLVTYALDQLGVTVTPFVAYTILIVGSLSILAGGIGGLVTVYKVIRRHRKQGLDAASNPPPLKIAFEVQRLRRIGGADAIWGEGQPGDVEVQTDILFSPKYPPVKPIQVMLEVHSKRIPARTLMGDIRQQVSHPYVFIVPQALAKDTDGCIFVTTDQGEAHSASQRIGFGSAGSVL
ncbi:MAG: hypothetical protein HY535_08110 [Chloroflexi bacterium]|nr:hypothetical protein [Chloroflexota bacterium]